MRSLLLWLLLCSTVAAQPIPWQAWEYREAMSESAWQTFGPSAPVALLAAQIHQESAWNCKAVSWAGAKGCSQFMDGTASDMALRYPSFCSPANPHDPAWGFRCRDLYMKEQIAALQNEFMSECDSWAFGLRAYNGGRGWINRDRRMAATYGMNPNSWVEVAAFNAGRKASAFKENTEYPVRIFRLEFRYESWGRSLSCQE